jgi:hypothetical protein
MRADGTGPLKPAPLVLCNRRLAVGKPRRGPEPAAPFSGPRPMHQTLTLSLALALASTLPCQRGGRAFDQQALEKLLQQYDKNHDGRIERSEYPRTAEGFANLDRDKNGIIDAADQATPAARPPRGGLPDLQGVALPKVGDLAPDFDLPMLGMKDKTVKLSSFRGDKPVALVFGSYT